MKYYLVIKRNKVLIHVTMWINLENIKLNKPDIEGETLYDSTQMDYLEEANSQRQKVDQRFPSAEGKGEWELLLNGYRVSVWCDEVLEIDSTDGCTTLWI